MGHDHQQSSSSGTKETKGEQMTHAEVWEVDLSLDDAVIVRVFSQPAFDLDEQWLEASEQLWQLIAPSLDTRFGVILDFAKCDYMGSRLLKQIVKLSKRVRVNDQQIVMCGLSPVVADIFDCPGPSPFTFTATVQDAIEVLRESAD